ncbi:hypothetical protein H1R17_02030 [Flavobacterium sp. xlx-214]|uniref:hypothetical protein n=1 Tax=unclassified Flavobacterium TaxID=196869 RepID=UPI0013D5972B|nr:MULTISPECIES: hypothetical protein [unclassified Flavobacterium]MBA5792802.1 hypothetical protein [Flavobacterium sp. xlx-221]QMI83938.1 hypothetical protein H1R17_02030 [Flavobacterium sp. xlx-214]
MKKITFIFLVAFLVLSCSSDDRVVNFCNEEVVSSYQEDIQLTKNVKNNVVAIEFNYGVSDVVVSEKLKELALFDLPLDEKGMIRTIMPDFVSTYPTKVVFGYFTEGNLSCEQLNTYIAKIQNITEVHIVRKVIQGSSKYRIYKETNILEIKVETEADVAVLNKKALELGLVVLEEDPSKINEKQSLVFYLVDESNKKSMIALAKEFSQTLEYSYIKPLYISI